VIIKIYPPPLIWYGTELHNYIAFCFEVFTRDPNLLDVSDCYKTELYTYKDWTGGYQERLVPVKEFHLS
jgi:hypothetical protein